MTDREAILKRIAPVTSQSTSRPDSDARAPERGVSTDLWVEFERALAPLGGTVADRSILSELGDLTVWADDDAQPYLPSTAHLAADIWSADVGLTTTTIAIAESGSLLLASGPGKFRLSSLAPPHHIAVVRRAAIVSTLENGLAQLETRNCVLITGPSRTADIEGVLVRGVHGPRDVTVIVVD